MDIDTFNEYSENKEDIIEIFQEEENIDFDDDIKEENNICISQYNKKGKKFNMIQYKIKIIKYANENSKIDAIKNIMFLLQHYLIGSKKKKNSKI